MKVSSSRIIQSRGKSNSFEDVKYLEKVAGIFEQMDFDEIVRLDASLAASDLHNLVLQHI